MSAPLLASIALYLAWRYGLRQARLAGALAIVAFAGACLQRTPHVVESAAVVALTLIAATLASRSWRRLAGSTLMAFAASALVLVAMVMIANLSAHRPMVSFPDSYIFIVAAQWVAFRYWPPEPLLGAAVATSLE
jgi:cell division protein FtsW (lipid II flippase)